MFVVCGQCKDVRWETRAEEFNNEHEQFIV